MATKTIAKLTGNPSIEDIVGFLQIADSISNVEVYNTTPAETFANGVVFEASAHVGFTYTTYIGESEDRTLTIFENVFDKSENSSVGPFVPENYAYLSLGKSGRSEEIIILLAEQFGGFVIPNDEEEDEFLIVNGTNDFVLSPITQELFDSLENMNLKEKYKFVKLVEENRDKIETYLGAAAV